jgi:quercetin dioxygenase-like cupin family protein
MFPVKFTRMKLPFLLSLIACSACAQEMIDKVVPITQEPSHHLILENKYVRVFNVEVAPHFATRIHRHDYDYVFVTLGDSDVSNEKVHADPVELKLKDGETHFTPGGFAHKAVNLADTPFHNITIEFVEPGLPSAGHVLGGTIPTNSAEMLSNDSKAFGLNINEDTLLKGEVSTCAADHVAGPQLLVPITQFLLRSASTGNQLHKPGEAIWLKAGECPTITSGGSYPVRFVILDFPQDGGRK